MTADRQRQEILQAIGRANRAANAAWATSQLLQHKAVLRGVLPVRGKSKNFQARVAEEVYEALRRRSLREGLPIGTIVANLVTKSISKEVVRHK